MIAAILLGTVGAQEVNVQLSSREAYVGQPLVLQISISNATDFKEPSIPQIDGYDVRSAGNPSQSSQITIINGRRSENRSVVMQYLITPRREGEFVIPAFEIEVDGRKAKTSPMEFVATKSETGDLLFVEIEGAKDKVFVGQELDLKLKIWIKPFVDQQKNIKLSEDQMWRLISEQSSWGSFAGRLQKLAENRQRPAGREVLRDDGTGKKRGYYLYEIEGSTYPKRPGKIEAEDVQIIVNYPTGLGKSRDPFESILGESPFSRLMDDDFFGGSPFASRLSITSTRPIVGQAQVDSTVVVAVPEEGRPAGYRGAVGKYQIVVQATPTQVSEGDPINLQIGIVGDGPMDLVQAPPLAELTRDFKVDDTLLAGFVKDEVKVFPTIIRPRNVAVTGIPPIPFSFFDPESETYKTVSTQSIPIIVKQAESLALDSIVGNARAVGQEQDELSHSLLVAPDFSNRNSDDLLINELPATNQWWLVFVVLPPVIWVATWIFHRPQFVQYALGLLLQFGRKRGHRALAVAMTKQEMDAALLAGLAYLLRVDSRRTSTEIVGAVRVAGLYSLAADLEAFLECGNNGETRSLQPKLLESWRCQAQELLAKISQSLAQQSRLDVRKSTQPTKQKSTPAAAKSTAMLCLALVLTSSSGTANGQDSNHDTQVAADRQSLASEMESLAKNEIDSKAVQLSLPQQQTILSEAFALYAKAIEIESSDRAEAKLLFTRAAAKYQLLVDAGVNNSSLYTNLANAYLKSNRLGLAIGNYERAKLIDPNNRQLQRNLKYASALVSSQSSVQARVANQVAGPTADWSLRELNRQLIQQTGTEFLKLTLSVASVLFWGLMIAAIFKPQQPIKSWSLIPLLVLLVVGTSLWLQTTDQVDYGTGVILASDIVLRAADGENFEEIARIDRADGQIVRVLEQRNGWYRIKTLDNQVGWVAAIDCLLVSQHRVGFNQPA
jgi:tetratricopeptide (TPR) repeat protein